MTQKNEVSTTVDRSINVATKGFLTIAGVEGKVSSIKVTENGFMKAINISIPLYLSEKHFYLANEWEFNNKQKPPQYEITAIGYMHLANKLGWKEVPIPYVNINGTNYNNPYFELDAMGKKSKIYAKKAVIAPNLSGDPQVYDATIVYDTNDSLCLDLMRKINKAAESGKEIGKYVPTKFAEKMQDLAFQQDGIMYSIYPLDSQTSILVDLMDTEIRKCMTTSTDNRDKTDRKLQTMAFRNACKKALAKSSVNPVQHNGDLVAWIKVTKWLNISDEQEKQIISEYLEKQEYDEFELMDDQIQEPEDDELAIVEDEPEEVDVKSGLISDILSSPLDREEVDELIKTISKKSLEELTEAQLIVLKKKVSEQLDGKIGE